MRYLALFCTGLWCISTNAQTLYVEAFGDSLTAGFMSKTDVTNPPPLSGPANTLTVSNIITDLATSFRVKNRAILQKYHWPDVAWPQQFVNGVKKQTKAKVVLSNYAVSGNRSYDVLDQVKQSSQQGKTIAFFFIGHNDLCDSYDDFPTATRNYKANMRDVLREWASRHKNSEAYIMPVGKVDEVFKLLQGYTWKKGTSLDYTCDQNWDRYFPYCRSHYKKLQDGTLYPFLKERIDGMNTALEQLVQDFQTSDRNNTYTYLKETHNAAYRREHFAVDCFHLSPLGQSELAERIQTETAKASAAGIY